MPCTVVFLLPYFGLDLFDLGLYLGFKYIMGVMLVPATTKYKSISVSVDTYKKIVQMSKKKRRNISQQLSLIVDDAYDKQGFIPPHEPIRSVSGGLSAVIED